MELKIEISKLNNAAYTDENGDVWTAKVEGSYDPYPDPQYRTVIWVRFYRNGRRQKKRLGDANNPGTCWKSESDLVDWFDAATSGMNGEEMIKALLDQHAINRKAY